MPAKKPTKKRPARTAARSAAKRPMTSAERMRKYRKRNATRLAESRPSAQRRMALNALRRLQARGCSIEELRGAAGMAHQLNLITLEEYTALAGARRR